MVGLVCLSNGISMRDMKWQQHNTANTLAYNERCFMSFLPVAAEARALATISVTEGLVRFSNSGKETITFLQQHCSNKHGSRQGAKSFVFVLTCGRGCKGVGNHLSD